MRQLALDRARCFGSGWDGLRSVVHLLKPIVALIVAPIDEDGPVIDAWATISPSLQALMY